MSQEIFTFWNGDSLFAIEVSSILSTQSYQHDEKPLPVKGNGLKGALMYRDRPTPIFDFAQSLGLASPFEEKLNLIKMLEERERDHIEWMQALEKAVLQNIPFDKATNPHQCAFGKWYDKYQSRDEELMRILKKFDEPHQHIHSLAIKLLQMCEKDRKSEALEILQQEKNNTLAKLLKLFEATRTHLQNSQRQVVMFVTQDGSTPLLGLVINEISDVHEVEEGDILPMENSSIGKVINSDRVGPMVKGYIRKDELECLLLQPERLLEVA